MSTITKTKHDIVSLSAVHKFEAYNEFVLWFAMPTDEKRKLGIESQREFCELHKISINTPTAWKKRKDFEMKVDEVIRQWAMSVTPDVFKGIYRSAVKGNPMSQALWLQYFKKWNPKADEKNNQSRPVEVSVNDIRHLINQLPEDLKQIHYGNIRQLLEDFQNLRHRGQIENVDVADDGPEGDIPDEADQYAQHIPDTAADEVPGSYSLCLRKNMEWQVLPYNHQGSAWRWEE